MQGNDIAEIMLSLREALKRGCPACIYHNLYKLNGVELSQEDYYETTAAVDKCAGHCEPCVMAHELCDYYADVRRQLDDLLEDRHQLQSRLEATEIDLAYTKSEVLSTSQTQSKDDFLIQEIETRFREHTQQLEKQLFEATARAGQLQDENTKLSTETERLSAAKSSLELQNSRLVMENTQHTSRFEETLRCSAVEAKTADEAYTRLKEVLRQFDQLRLEVNENKLNTQLKMQESAEYIAQKDAQIANLSNELAVERKRLVDERHNFKRHVEFAEYQVEKTEQKLAELQIQLDESKSICENYAANEERLNTEQSSLLERLKYAEYETRGKASELADCSYAIYALKAYLQQLAGTSRERDELAEQKQKLLDTIYQLNYYLTESYQNVNYLRDMSTYLTTKNFDLYDKVQQLYDELKTATDQLESYEIKINKLEEQRVKLNELKVNDMFELMKQVYLSNQQYIVNSDIRTVNTTVQTKSYNMTAVQASNYSVVTVEPYSNQVELKVEDTPARSFVGSYHGSDSQGSPYNPSPEPNFSNLSTNKTDKESTDEPKSVSSEKSNYQYDNEND